MIKGSKREGSEDRNYFKQKRKEFDDKRKQIQADREAKKMARFLQMLKEMHNKFN
jgi:hypothetical protein